MVIVFCTVCPTHRPCYAAAFNALCIDIWHPQVKGSRYFMLPIKRMEGGIYYYYYYFWSILSFILILYHVQFITVNEKFASANSNDNILLRTFFQGFDALSLY